MIQYKMRLPTEPFTKIVTGKKVVESRLLDEKRQQIKLGDKIEFREVGNEINIQNTRVIGLLQYDSFEHLFTDHNPEMFGGTTKDLLLSEIRGFYTQEDEQSLGVVGIRLQAID